ELTMATVPPPPPTKAAQRELVIIRHSPLFYWWPVWGVGFILALISYMSGQRLAIVPTHTQVHVPVKDKEIVKVTITRPQPQGGEKIDTIVGQPILLAPDDKHFHPAGDFSNPQREPYLHISSSKNLGILFFTVILLVIVFTSIQLRGLWSVMIIIVIVALVIIFALMGVWDNILNALSFLDVRINQGGYLFFSTVLFILWLLIFLFFDQQIYIVFTPVQIRVRHEIGLVEVAISVA